jgi:crotonobetainyl-CoA:carnitine CoA-transferase CaiB-like acyl-CoA transferase
MKGHLEGIRVVDLTAYLSGPYVGLNFAAMGAEVIKVERPKIGDPCQWNPPFAGSDGVTLNRKDEKDLSLLYLKRNRKKKSIFLNLQSEKGKSIFTRLVEKSDIVIENFAPGVMERLGFTYAELEKINPKIIFCSISGYGQDGPYRDRAAFDLTIQATSGIMGITGFPDGPPTRCGAWIGDLTSSYYSMVGILAALVSREKTGHGERIDVSMQDSCFSMIMDEALDFHLSTGVPMRTGNRNPRLAPWNAYEARDGFIVIAVANNVQWEAFLGAIEREDLKEDDRFKNPEGRFKNSCVVEDMVNNWIKKYTKEQALSRLRKYKVPCDTVPEIDEVLDDQHLKYRGMIQELKHPTYGGTGIKTSGFPIHFTRLPGDLSQSSPYPGQHNDEIYQELLGMRKDMLEELKMEGVI